MSGEKQGSPGHTYDVTWTRGGRSVGGCPTTNSCVISHRPRFLPVKLSTVDVMNIWGPGYR